MANRKLKNQTRKQLQKPAQQEPERDLYLVEVWNGDELQSQFSLWAENDGQAENACDDEARRIFGVEEEKQHAEVIPLDGNKTLAESPKGRAPRNREGLN
jgi:hypothetical protein